MKLHNFIFPAQQTSQAEKWEVRNFRQNKIWLIKSRFVKISNLSQKRDYVFGKVCWIWDFWVYYKTETHHWNFAFTTSSVLQIQFHRKDKLCVMIVLVDLPSECAFDIFVLFFYPFANDKELLFISSDSWKITMDFNRL